MKKIAYYLESIAHSGKKERSRGSSASGCYIQSYRRTLFPKILLFYSSDFCHIYAVELHYISLHYNSWDTPVYKWFAYLGVTEAKKRVYFANRIPDWRCVFIALIGPWTRPTNMINPRKKVNQLMAFKTLSELLFLFPLPSDLLCLEVVHIKAVWLLVIPWEDLYQAWIFNGKLWGHQPSSVAFGGSYRTP